MDKAYLCSCFGLYVALLEYRSKEMELELPNAIIIFDQVI